MSEQTFGRRRPPDVTINKIPVHVDRTSGSDHRADRTNSDIPAFRNPVNGYVEEATLPWLWCALFGCFYLGFKGAYFHAVAAGFLAFFTAGFSWLVYPFFAKHIVTQSYLRRGWQQVDAAPATSGGPASLATMQAEMTKPGDKGLWIFLGSIMLVAFVAFTVFGQVTQHETTPQKYGVGSRVRATHDALICKRDGDQVDHPNSGPGLLDVDGDTKLPLVHIVTDMDRADALKIAAQHGCTIIAFKTLATVGTSTDKYIIRVQPDGAPGFGYSSSSWFEQVR